MHALRQIDFAGRGGIKLLLFNEIDGVCAGPADGVNPSDPVIFTQALMLSAYLQVCHGDGRNFTCS